MQKPPEAKEYIGEYSQIWMEKVMSVIDEHADVKKLVNFYKQNPTTYMNHEKYVYGVSQQCLWMDGFLQIDIFKLL